MMKISLIRAFATTATIVVALATWSLFSGEAAAQSSQESSAGPHFNVDPSWPKPLPDRWVTGEVAGTCVDSNDHVFIVNRSDLTPKQQKMATPAPPVIELDQEGNIVNSWGNHETLPASRHGCFIDYQGNFWI